MSLVQRLVLDVESTSTVDLRKAGAAAYWAHPDTRVLCVCFAVDDEPTRTWLPGEPVPDEIIWAACGNHRVVAHNYLFELNCWQSNLIRAHGWPNLEFTAWDCTMARAFYWGLPAGLGDVCDALKLPVRKDASARALMLRMSRPRTVEPTLTWWDQTDPEKLTALIAYCAQDVEAERCLDDALPALPTREREIFLVDGKINQRGIRVDLPIVETLGRVTRAEGNRLNYEVGCLTKGAVNTTNQVAAIVSHLGTLGVSVSGLARADVSAALDMLSKPAGSGTPEARTAARILRCRQEAAKASTAKLAAMKAGVSPDGRCRGLFQYGGAGRTLRWAGRRVQPQNYPRGSLKGIPSVFRVLEANPDISVDDLAMLIPGSVMDTVSSCLRGCFIPKPGYSFVSGDLSQIEARVVAWLAGQQDILDVFARGDDVYTFTAKRIGSDNRQLGKVCVAEGTPVLTSTGWRPIETLTIKDKIWDGGEWVAHHGLLDNGTQETLSGYGLPLTPEHLVLCGTAWLPAQSLAQDGAAHSRALATASENLPSRDLSPTGAAACPARQTARTSVGSGICRTASPSLRPKSRVYDLANCGPRNRFVILTRLGPLIVHNCVLGLGFGMGAGKFIETAKTYGITLDAATAEEIVRKWREKNERIVRFWWDVDYAAKEIAVSPHGAHTKVCWISLRKTRKALRIVLPSGREITYHNVEVNTDEFGHNELSYMGVDPNTKNWSRIRTYGGRLVENIVQATARDVMAEAMRKLAKEPDLALVATVHDELLAEAPTPRAEAALRILLWVMKETPAWAPDLPIGAEGWIGQRYRK